MDIKTKLLLNLMYNNEYFTDLNEYLTEKVEKEELSYKNLKYLYTKLYLNKSLYMRQNIFPVCEFLIKGYKVEDAEKLAKLLPDAHKLTVFCYEEKEKGYLYNKLFMDLRFLYMKYDEYTKRNYEKDRVLEIVKEDIELTTISQRELEVKLNSNEIKDRRELEEYCEDIYIAMKKLREEFEQNTLNDKSLVEYFKNDIPKERFTSIKVAGSVLGGIQLRNIWRENNNLDGEKEVFPYNEEQIEMINKYNRLEETLDKVEYYAEFVFEDEEEIE